jgi:hypothetical protein
MKPTGLASLTLAMCVLNLTGFLFLEEGRRSGLALAFVSVTILVGYLVLWYFWKGRNWARWLVLVTSAVAVLNLAALPFVPVIQKLVIVVEAPLGGFLLYWLNTRTVRAFFAR